MAQQSTGMQASVTMPGAANSAGDRRALYLKLFSGEMFKGFQHQTIARDLIMKRTLSNGKSLQFNIQVVHLLNIILPEIVSSVTPMVHLQ